jgi:hypothetical protein
MASRIAMEMVSMGSSVDRSTSGTVRGPRLGG